MRISRIVAPVTVLGPGRRAGLWVQGCDLACPGCASTDTWPREGGTSVGVADVVGELESLIRGQQLTGLTVSGGEPFQQAVDVAAVLRGVREAAPDLDVLVFTGLTGIVARRRSPAMFELADAIVTGRYDRRRPSTAGLLASSNQELHLLTERGRTRFTHLESGRLQVSAGGGGLSIIGLPAPGDLDRLLVSLSEQGVQLEGVSWQP